MNKGELILKFETPVGVFDVDESFTIYQDEKEIHTDFSIVGCKNYIRKIMKQEGDIQMQRMLEKINEIKTMADLEIYRIKAF